MCKKFLHLGYLLHACILKMDMIWLCICISIHYTQNFVDFIVFFSYPPVSWKKHFISKIMTQILAVLSSLWVPLPSLLFARLAYTVYSILWNLILWSFSSGQLEQTQKVKSVINFRMYILQISVIRFILFPFSSSFVVLFWLGVGGHYILLYILYSSFTFTYLFCIFYICSIF